MERPPYVPTLLYGWRVGPLTERGDLEMGIENFTQCEKGLENFFLLLWPIEVLYFIEIGE